MTGKVTDEDSEPMFGAAWAEASAWFVLREVLTFLLFLQGITS